MPHFPHCQTFSVLDVGRVLFLEMLKMTFFPFKIGNV